MSIFSTSHVRIKIEDAPINLKKLRTLSGFQQVYNQKQQVVGRVGWGWGGGRLTFWRVQFPQFLKELVPQKMGNPAQTLLIQVQPRTQQPPELISNDLGSTTDPLNRIFFGTGAPKGPR